MTPPVVPVEYVFAFARMTVVAMTYPLASKLPEEVIAQLRSEMVCASRLNVAGEWSPVRSAHAVQPAGGSLLLPSLLFKPLKSCFQRRDFLILGAVDALQSGRFGLHSVRITRGHSRPHERLGVLL